MNRSCAHAVRCNVDPDSPLGFSDYSSMDISPAASVCANAIACAGTDDPFANYSSEFDDDAEFFRDILDCACVDDEFFLQVRAPGFVPPFTWNLVGDLPPGLVFNENFPTNGDLTINGGFAASGHFEFTIQVTDGWGNLFEKDVVFNVLEILTFDLPLPETGVPYSFQLEAAGGSGNYAWRIVQGWLPEGLLLNTSGLIIGTPLTDTTVPVRFQVVDTSCVLVLDETFSPVPKIAMVGRAVTTIATVYGFDEFTASGIIPTPKYKRMDWSGGMHQEMTFQGMPHGPTIMGNITLDLTGASTLGPHGEPVNLRLIDGTTGCRSTILLTPAGLCAGPGLTLWHGAYGGVDSRDWNWPNVIGSGPPTSVTPTQADTVRDGAVADAIYYFGRRYGFVDFHHNFSRLLSDEYTEAEALANAVVANSDALVAVNFPRTTGFVSTYSTCEFDLICTNLQLNTAYIAEVTFISSTGAISTQQYPFTTGTDEATDKTHTITDTIPTPVAGAFTLVSNPTIDFA